MNDPNSCSADYGPLTGIAFKVIMGMLGKDVKGWSGPKITAENGTYKLDWYAADYDNTGEYLTLYDDGAFQLYQDDEIINELKIPPLHFRGWIDKMIDAKVSGTVAVFAVDFFKVLKKK